MKNLTESLERSVVICAERNTVFRFFTDSALFADWWGAGSSIEGKPGGAVRICYPNAIVVSGEILDIRPPERIVFTYGYESGKPAPAGSTRVTVTLHEHAEGTLLHLRHDFEEAAIRDMHIQGWKYQLALFANAAARVQHAHFRQTLEDYYSAWNLTDAAARTELVERITAPDVRFRDAYGCVSGREELLGHIAAVQQYMPGMSLQLDGEPAQCQGTAMARWVSHNADGKENARGTNMFHFTPSGRIASIVGYWQKK